MDQKMKEIIENFQKMTIGVDEEFKFHCTQCGKCCINRDDILLNPKDIYNMSKELGVKPEDMLEQYCEKYIGGDSHLPIVRIKPKGSIKRCPLLKDRKCLVHKAKPTVCAMFPIGRGIVMQNDKSSYDKTGQEEIKYIFTNPKCGDDAEVHTVREWLNSFGIPLEDKFFMKWQKVIRNLSEHLQKLEKKCSEKSMNAIWTAIYIMLYVEYDTEQEFMPQFERNTITINTVIENI